MAAYPPQRSVIFDHWRSGIAVASRKKGAELDPAETDLAPQSSNCEACWEMSVHFEVATKRHFTVVCWSISSLYIYVCGNPLETLQVSFFGMSGRNTSCKVSYMVLSSISIMQWSKAANQIIYIIKILHIRPESESHEHFYAFYSCSISIMTEGFFNTLWLWHSSTGTLEVWCAKITITEAKIRKAHVAQFMRLRYGT